MFNSHNGIPRMFNDHNGILRMFNNQNGNPGMFVSGPLLPFRARRMPEAPRNPARHCRAASLGSTRLVGQFRGQGGKGLPSSLCGAPG